MRNILLVTALVLFVVVCAFTPASAGPDSQGTIIAQAAPEPAPAPAADEKKEEPKKEEPKKEEPKKEEPKAEPAAAGTVPETITLEICGKFGPVVFNHKTHGEKNACKDCHEGDKPLFEKKVSKTGWKMADMYAGQNCGACHDGKKAFEAKKACMKCHQKK